MAVSFVVYALRCPRAKSCSQSKDLGKPRRTTVEFFSKVEDTFVVPGRGLVVVPEKPETDFRIRVGTPIELRTPEGRSIKTHITGVEFLKQATGPCDMALLITRDVNKDEVPSGTEIWYLRDDPGVHPPSGSQPV